MLKQHLAKAMPLFGLDIGGTLTKLVYFETTDRAPDRQDPETEVLGNIRNYLMNNTTYGKTGRRDIHLQMDNVHVGKRHGSVHFIRFQTIGMNNFLQLAKKLGMAKLVSRVCATGGGAFKFENDFRQKINMKLVKFDELDTLVRGVLFAEIQNPTEIYYYANARDCKRCTKTTFDFTCPYPFILVNVGSGVSILAVHGPDTYRRVMGSCLGGGTFLGLCYLLTGCNSFKEAMQLAAAGDNTKVDKLVKDIYGGDYLRFGLTGDLVASCFGRMKNKADREKVEHADLARAALVSISTNLASIAHLCALNEHIDRVLFVGNFWRENAISMKLLSHAMDYWSGGTMKSLFLEHEGYFGALGCLLQFNEKMAATAKDTANTAQQHVPETVV